MKPKNFPNRVNQRRLIAFSHLSTPNYQKTDEEDNQRTSTQEEQSLQASIVPNGRRDVRTKKDRRSLA